MGFLSWLGIDNTTVAKNIADENVSAVAQVINDAVQNCSQNITNEVFNFIDAQKINVGGNFVVNTENTLIVKQQCLQSIQAVTDLETSLQAAASQTAAAISQQLQLSSAKAKNVIDINAQIADEIKNVFVQNCSLQGFDLIANNIKLNDDTIGGSVIINSKNYVDSVVSCSTNSSTIDNLKQKLVVQIQQEATAKVESFLLPFFIAIAIIIGIIALFLFLPALFRGSKSKTTTSSTGTSNGDLALLEAAAASRPRQPVTRAPVGSPTVSMTPVSR